MAAPSLQLVYFPVRAKAESIRMILHYGGIAFSDLSVSEAFDGKGWGEAKAETPFGQLPLLLVGDGDDRTPLAQSAAINRYCAGLVGESLLPSDPLAAAQADAVFEAAQELAGGNPIVNVFRGDDFAAKKRAYFESEVPRRVDNIVRNLLEAEHGGPFCCGSQIRYSDFAIYHQFDIIRLLEPSYFDNMPAVGRFFEAVEALPGVGEYLASRPEAVDIGVKPMLRAKEL